MGEARSPCPARHCTMRGRYAGGRSGVVAQESERALVPVGSQLAGTPRVSNGEVDAPRLVVAAAFGLAVEVQRRSFDAAGAVAGRFAGPLRVLTRPAVSFARGSVAVARHHLDLDTWAARGLAEQRRVQAAAVQGVRTLIAALVTAVLDEINLDEVVARVDLDQVVARIDLDAIVERIDVGAIVERVDVGAIVEQVDVDAIAGRIDLDAVASRIDLAGLTEQVIDEVDLGEIIRESSSTMASETVDALRVQGMRVDGLVSRVVDRILFRQGERQTGPLPEEPRP